MTTPRPEQVAAWWQTLADHRQRGGVCPICNTARRCQARADAFAALIETDQYHLGPPTPTTVRNQRPADYLGAQ